MDGQSDVIHVLYKKAACDSIGLQQLFYAAKMLQYCQMTKHHYEMTPVVLNISAANVVKAISACELQKKILQ